MKEGAEFQEQYLGIFMDRADIQVGDPVYEILGQGDLSNWWNVWLSTKKIILNKEESSQCHKSPLPTNDVTPNTQQEI